MTGVVPKFTGGPITYEVSAKVRAGRLVAANAGGLKTVAEAGAGSKLVLGVALIDAIPTATAIQDDFNVPVIATHAYPKHTTVAGPGYVVPVTFAADTPFGALVKAAAGGTATPAVFTGADPDTADMIVGKCVEPGGVDVSENAVGLLLIQF